VDQTFNHDDRILITPLGVAPDGAVRVRVRKDTREQLFKGWHCDNLYLGTRSETEGFRYTQQMNKMSSSLPNSASALLFVACGGLAACSSQSSSNAPWPEHLDAVVAAPLHHRALLENERVRVLDTTINPGETVPLHTHRWPAAYYILSTGDFVRRDASGVVTLDSRELSETPAAGSAIWSSSLGPHTLENVGHSVIRVISVEVKNAE